MILAAARPSAMLLLGPASRLAWSAHRQGSAFTKSLYKSIAFQQHQKRGCKVPAAEQAAAAAAPHADDSKEPPQLSVIAASPTATQFLAHFFACDMQPADCYLLYGSVGAGKSYFSRAFIRAAADDEDLPVPSPTFLLQNIYTDHQGPPIHHFDLYRLTQQYDLARLDLAASFSQAVSLVEWAERLALAPASSAGSDSSTSTSTSTSTSSSGHSGSGSSAGSSGSGGSSSPSALPRDPLSVRISIVEAAEQERLRHRLQAQQAGAPTHGEEEGEEGEEERGYSSSEGDGDGSGDARWRRVELAPADGAGSTRWRPRLQLLRQYLQAEGPALGCYLL